MLRFVCFAVTMGWSLGLSTPSGLIAQTCSLTLDCSLASTFDNGLGATMPYRFFSPSDVNVTERLPLIVFMHGAGERGTDNVSQVNRHIGGLIDATQTQAYRSFLLAPQLPSGAGWFPNSSTDFTIEIMQDLISRHPIDPNRIYLTGLSLGGFGTTSYVAQHPDMFAAAVPLSGATGITMATAESMKDVPFWLFHGDLDNVVSVNTSRNFVAQLQSVGGNVQYTELAGQRHNIWSPIYSDWQTNNHGLYPWLFSQSRAIAIPEPGIVTPLILAALAQVGVRRRSRITCDTNDPLAEAVQAAI